LHGLDVSSRDSNHVDAAISSLREVGVIRAASWEAAEIALRTEEKFLVPGEGWWWERIREPYSAAHFEDDRAFEHLPGLAPAADAPCHLLVDVGENEPAAYALTPRLASRVLAECLFMEYYLVGSECEWLLCENHHGLVIAAGAVAERDNSANAA
jgi:hypothetical protein